MLQTALHILSPSLFEKKFPTLPKIPGLVFQKKPHPSIKINRQHYLFQKTLDCYGAANLPEDGLINLSVMVSMLLILLHLNFQHCQTNCGGLRGGKGRDIQLMVVYILLFCPLPFMCLCLKSIAYIELFVFQSNFFNLLYLFFIMRQPLNFTLLFVVIVSLYLVRLYI